MRDFTCYGEDHYRAVFHGRCRTFKNFSVDEIDVYNLAQKATSLWMDLAEMALELAKRDDKFLKRDETDRYWDRKEEIIKNIYKAKNMSDELMNLLDDTHQLFR